MNNDAIRLLNEAGFHPPQVRFSKPDPRGPEYGRFTAVVESDVQTGSPAIVRVSKHDGDADTGSGDWDADVKYTMTMSIKSFIEWAKDCT